MRRIKDTHLLLCASGMSGMGVGLQLPHYLSYKSRKLPRERESYQPQNSIAIMYNKTSYVARLEGDFDQDTKHICLC